MGDNNGRLIALADGVLAGRRRAVAQAITLVEAGGSGAEELLAALHPSAGRAHVIGVTGSPGIGKSTLVAALARRYRQRQATVGIVAVDPTSPFSGGAILGDRVRMRELAGDCDVFIRSMATRGHLGGLAAATSDVICVLDAAGCHVILVETVGVGQGEIEVARLAHTTVVVEAPGLGDDIQTLKAGIMEIADIFVVNKADLPGASGVISSLKAALEFGEGKAAYLGPHSALTGLQGRPADPVDGDPAWQIPVLEVSAVQSTGLGELVDRIDAHRTYLQEGGLWAERERRRAEMDLESMLKKLLFDRFAEQMVAADLREVVDQVASRRIDPRSAAGELLQKYRAL